jgi:hypothetical protein
LLCGFERDGSCGYEAVTNILPLLPASVWRNKVYDMMHKASRIIEDRYLSIRQASVAAIFLLAVEGMSGAELMILQYAKIRIDLCHVSSQIAKWLTADSTLVCKQ